MTWEDRGWTCKVAFGYDGDGRRVWKREYLPRPLGVVVRLTLYAGYGFEEGYVEEVQPHAAGEVAVPGDVCGKVEGVTDLGFTGQRQEIGFGLYDYKARYFSPALGRFISPDPIVPNYSNPQSLNRYAYVYNNPVRYTDSTGHQCDTCDIPWEILGAEFVDIWEGGQIWTAEQIEMILTGEYARRSIRAGVPSTIGIQISVSGSGDIIMGYEGGASKIVMFNWYSLEFTELNGLQRIDSVGTPEGVALGEELNLWLGFGATRNELFSGPVDSKIANFDVDVFTQAGYAAEWGHGVDDEGELTIDKDNMGEPVRFFSIGISRGINAIPNFIDFRLGESPGASHNDSWVSWSWSIYDLWE